MSQPTAMPMGNYNHFIYLSRYSRYLHDQGRRETWPETIARYFDFFKIHLKETCGFILTKEIRQELESAVLNMKVMPSMRCLMTAGPALERDNIAGYNCSYLSIDHPKAFAELMYILLCGTGVGFSVETMYTDKLPEIPDELHPSETMIVVGDSKLGWAKALNELVSLLYTGYIPKWDVSKVRPAGSLLKTFGGRASGPEPLVRLFQFVVGIFKNAKGKKLSSLDCHDISCMVGDCVVVGGVRRSALISLSDLSDDRMRHAKTGQWWKLTPHRQLSNNSAVYNDKQPSMELFINEWKSLYDSKSGERGIVSRYAAKVNIERSNELREEWFPKNAGLTLRDPNYNFGTNPCVTKDNLVTTLSGLKTVESLINRPFYAVVNGKKYKSTGFWKTGVKDVYSVMTKKGYSFKCTDNHVLIHANGQELPLKDSKVGDCLRINKNKNVEVQKNSTFDKGWIVGEVVGDGCFNPEKYHGLVRFWGEQSKVLSDKAYQIVESWDLVYNQPVKPQGPTYNIVHDTYQVCSKKITDLCDGLIDNEKNILPALEQKSIDFVAGFIRGIFDADGCVGGDQKEQGIYLQLGQINLANLKAIQRMLILFGIESRIHETKKSKYEFLSDGKGGQREYFCQQMYRLDIGRDNLDSFAQNIGFYDEEKSERLNSLLSARSKMPYRSRFEDQIVSIEHVGQEDVYDCTVADVHMFDVNGILVHNCSEIILRDKQFCNLTEVVARYDDSWEILAEKVRLATILGTFQSTLTDFRFIGKRWKDNTEEERLLGVSITGIMDSLLLSNPDPKMLLTLRQVAVQTNREWSQKLGIPMSAAVTCVKPSGTVSQLVDSASGIHARHSQFYLRSVRNNKRDPISHLMIEQGFPHEQDLMNFDQLVFYFPVKSPDNAITRHDMSAIQQLELWKTYQQFWTEHKPSITVSVREEEWMDVGSWVYDNFEYMAGVSFLPMSEHIYKQSPYQDISEDEFKQWGNKMPTKVDWHRLTEFEKEDTTTGTQELACNAAGGGCDL